MYYLILDYCIDDVDIPTFVYLYIYFKNFICISVISFTLVAGIYISSSAFLLLLNWVLFVTAQGGSLQEALTKFLASPRLSDSLGIIPSQVFKPDYIFLDSHTPLLQSQELSLLGISDTIWEILL